MRGGVAARAAAYSSSHHDDNKSNKHNYDNNNNNNATKHQQHQQQEAAAKDNKQFLDAISSLAAQQQDDDYDDDLMNNTNNNNNNQTKNRHQKPSDDPAGGTMNTTNNSSRKNKSVAFVQVDDDGKGKKGGDEDEDEDHLDKQMVAGANSSTDNDSDKDDELAQTHHHDRRFLYCGRRVIINMHENAFYFFDRKNKLRIMCIDFVDSMFYDVFIIMIIILSVAVYVMDTPAARDLPGAADFASVCEYIIQGIYTLEMIIKMIAMGPALHPYAYLRDPLRFSEFLIVIAGFAAIPLEGGWKTLRNLKLVRLVHALERMMKYVPELRGVFEALRSSQKSLRDLTALYFVVAIAMAILGLQIFRGAFQQRCYLTTNTSNPDAGSDFQTLDPRFPNPCTTSPSSGGAVCLAGAVCGTNADVYTDAFTNFDHVGNALFEVFKLTAMTNWQEEIKKVQFTFGPYAALYPLSIVLICAFGLMNFFVAILSVEYEIAAERHLSDEDQGFFESLLYNIHTATLPDEFFLDSWFLGGSRLVIYKRVVNTPWMRWVSVAVTLLNILSLAIFAYNLPAVAVEVINWINFLCGLYFIVEAFFRIFTLGTLYFKAFINLFDLALALLAVFELAFRQTEGLGSIFASLRALRALSVFRLAIQFDRARQLLVTISYATRTSFLMFLLILAYVIIFGIFAVYLFDDKVPTTYRPNFSNLRESILAMFIILTSENWTTTAREAMIGTSNGLTGAFFVIFFFIGYFLLVNFFLVIVITCYSRAAQQFDSAHLDKKIKAAIALIDDAEVQEDNDERDEFIKNIGSGDNDDQQQHGRPAPPPRADDDDEVPELNTEVKLTEEEMRQHMENLMGEVQMIDKSKDEEGNPTTGDNSAVVIPQNNNNHEPTNEDGETPTSQEQQVMSKSFQNLNNTATTSRSKNNTTTNNNTTTTSLQNTGGESEMLGETQRTLGSTTTKNRTGMSTLQRELQLMYEVQKKEEQDEAERKQKEEEEEEKKRKEQEDNNGGGGSSWWGSLGTMFKSAVTKATDAVKSAYKVPSGVAAAAKRLARVDDEEELDNLNGTFKRGNGDDLISDFNSRLFDDKKKKKSTDSSSSSSSESEEEIDDDDFDMVEDIDGDGNLHEDHFDLNSTATNTSYGSLLLTGTDGTSTTASTTMDNYSDTLLALLASQGNLQAQDDDDNNYLRQKRIDEARKLRAKKRAALTGEEGNEEVDDSGFTVAGGEKILKKAINIWAYIAGFLGIEYSKTMDPQKIVRKGCWGVARRQYVRRENKRRRAERAKRQKDREEKIAKAKADVEEMKKKLEEEQALSSPTANNQTNTNHNGSNNHNNEPFAPPAAILKNSMILDDTSVNQPEEPEKTTSGDQQLEGTSTIISSPNRVTIVLDDHNNNNNNNSDERSGSPNQNASVTIEGKNDASDSSPKSRQQQESDLESLDENDECCCNCACGARYTIAVIVFHPLFDMLSFLFYFDACIAVGFNADYVLGTFDDNAKNILFINNIVITSWFWFEVLLKLIALSPEYYVRNSWNIYDFLVAVFSLVAIFVPSLDFTRALWIVRLVAKWHPQKKMLSALAGALPQILNVGVLLVVTMLTFSILGVHMFSGQFAFCNDPDIQNQSACVGNYTKQLNYLETDADVTNLLNLTRDLPREQQSLREWQQAFFNYNNLGEGFISCFVLLWGDGWSGILFQGMDSIDTTTAMNSDPGWRPEAVIYFIAFTFIGNLVMKNLFVSSLLESFATRSLRDLGYVDKYNRRLLTREQESWIRNYRFAKTVETNPPAPQPSSTIRKYACWMYFSDYDRGQIRPQFEMAVVICILLNVSFMASEFSGQPEYWTTTLFGQNLAFVILYCIEIIITGLAVTPSHFIRDPWHVFNLMIVSTAFLDMFLPGVGGNVFTVVRVLRLLRVIRRSPGLYRFFEAVVYAAPQITNVTITLVLVLYVFGVTATSLFENIYIDEADPTSTFTRFFNYRHAGFSMMTLIQAVTTAGWSVQMQSIHELSPLNSNCSLDDGTCGTWLAIPFFLVFMALAQSVFVNLYIFVIVSNFLEMSKLHEVESQWLFAILRDFRTLWSKVDTEGLHVIPWEEFVRIMERLTLLERDCAKTVRERVGVPTKFIRGANGELMLKPLVDSSSGEKHSAESLETEMQAVYEPEQDEALQVTQLTHRQRKIAFSVFAAFGAVDMDAALGEGSSNTNNGNNTLTAREQDENTKNREIFEALTPAEKASFREKQMKRRERALFLRIRSMAIPTSPSPIGAVVRFNDCLFGITRAHAGMASKKLTARAKRFVQKLRPNTDDRNFKVHHAMAAQKILNVLTAYHEVNKTAEEIEGGGGKNIHCDETQHTLNKTDMNNNNNTINTNKKMESTHHAHNSTHNNNNHNVKPIIAETLRSAYHTHNSESGSPMIIRRRSSILSALRSQQQNRRSNNDDQQDAENSHEMTTNNQERTKVSTESADELPFNRTTSSSSSKNKNNNNSSKNSTVNNLAHSSSNSLDASSNNNSPLGRSSASTLNNTSNKKLAPPAPPVGSYPSSPDDKKTHDDEKEDELAATTTIPLSKQFAGSASSNTNTTPAASPSPPAPQRQHSLWEKLRKGLSGSPEVAKPQQKETDDAQEQEKEKEQEESSQQRPRSNSNAQMFAQQASNFFNRIRGTATTGADENESGFKAAGTDDSNSTKTNNKKEIKDSTTSVTTTTPSKQQQEQDSRNDDTNNNNKQQQSSSSTAESPPSSTSNFWGKLRSAALSTAKSIQSSSPFRSSSTGNNNNQQGTLPTFDSIAANRSQRGEISGNFREMGREIDSVAGGDGSLWIRTASAGLVKVVSPQGIYALPLRGNSDVQLRWRNVAPNGKSLLMYTSPSSTSSSEENNNNDNSNSNNQEIQEPKPLFSKGKKPKPRMLQSNTSFSATGKIFVFNQNDGDDDEEDYSSNNTKDLRVYVEGFDPASNSNNNNNTTPQKFCVPLSIITTNDTENDDNDNNSSSILLVLLPELDPSDSRVSLPLDWKVIVDNNFSKIVASPRESSPPSSTANLRIDTDAAQEQQDEDQKKNSTNKNIDNNGNNTQLLTSPLKQDASHHHALLPPFNEIKDPEKEAYIVVYCCREEKKKEKTETEEENDDDDDEEEESSSTNEKKKVFYDTNKLYVSVVACGIEWAVWKGAICRRPFDASNFIPSSMKSAFDDHQKGTAHQQKYQTIMSRCIGAPEPPPFFASSNSGSSNGNKPASSFEAISIARVGPLLPNAANGIGKKVKNLFTQQVPESSSSSSSEEGKVDALVENRKFAEVMTTAVVEKLETMEWAPSLYKTVELDSLFKLIR